MFCTEENGFDREGLSYNRNKKITGRKLNDNALDCIKIYKHALEFYKEYRGSQQQENPSGLKLEDMLSFVRKKMCAKCKGASDPAGARNKTEAADEEDMPGDYVFKGFLTFAVFGPPPLSRRSFSCLTENGNDVPTKGRAETWKETAEEAAKGRNAGGGGCVPAAHQGRRGVSLEAKASVANLAQRELMSEHKTLSDQLFVETTTQRNTLDEIAAIGQGLEDACNCNNPNQNHIQRMEDHLNCLCASLPENFQRKKRHQKMSEDLMNEAMPKEMSSHIDQVGDFREGNPCETPVVAGSQENPKNGTSSQENQGVNTETSSPESDADSPPRNNVLQAAVRPALDDEDSIDSDSS